LHKLFFVSDIPLAIVCCRVVVVNLPFIELGIFLDIIVVLIGTYVQMRSFAKSLFLTHQLSAGLVWLIAKYTMVGGQILFCDIFIYLSQP